MLLRCCVRVALLSVTLSRARWRLQAFCAQTRMHAHFIRKCHRESRSSVFFSTISRCPCARVSAVALMPHDVLQVMGGAEIDQASGRKPVDAYEDWWVECETEPIG